VASVALSAGAGHAAAMTSLLVVGGNAAGMSCAAKAKRRAPDLEVTVLEAGPNISYSSCGIPHLISGAVEAPEDLLVLTPEQAGERGLKVLTSTAAVALNAYTKEVTVQGPDGRDALHYDKLCIATGSAPLNPLKGGDLKGVFALRHVWDGVRLMEHVDSAKSKRFAIVGGGHVGLEMAEAFHKRGTEVHLFEKGPHLLPRFDADITDGLDEFAAQKGIKVHLGSEVKSLAEGRREGHVGVVHSSEKDANVDGVLVAVGIRPQTAFATKGGVHALSTGHLLVDDTMRTNFHDMWAAGDCVAARHLITGRPTGLPMALPSNRMGRVAGDSIAASLERIPGPSQSFGGVVGTTAMRFFGLGFAQTGLNEKEAKKEGFDVVTSLVETKSKAAYMPGARDMAVKMVADRDSGKMLGAELAGPEDSVLRINAAAVALQAGMTVRKFAEVETLYAPSFSPVWDPLLVAAGEIAKDLRK
jgi:NADPH-dependent 2,4-dienoyl-CoA reductase/sulfur reductase-like enzyme